MDRRESLGKADPNRSRISLVDIVKEPELSIRDFYGPREHWRIVKNMMMLGLTFTLLFTAYMAMANLQSSINSEDGIGLYSLAACYGAFLLSSLFLPPFLLAKLKSKWTLLLAVSGYILFQSAQFYPRFGTLIPAAIYLGTCAAPLWAAQATYLQLIAEEYAFLRNQNPETVLQRFFGIFFLCFHSSQVWGNMISSFVLSSPVSESTDPSNHSTMHFEKCGANYCPAAPVAVENASLSEHGGGGSGIEHKPDTWKINVLISIFVGSTVAAGLVIFFLLDSLKRYGENERGLVKKAKWNSLFIATIKHWKKPTQLLVIPVSIWLGIQEAFIGAEFTKGYIACAWGVESIGFVMMCFGICAAISSLIIGKVMEYVGRPVVFMTAAALNLACFVAMLKWEPNPSEPMIFFVISGVWGIADGVWSPQIKALYGTIFSSTREAGFSNAGLWLSIGFITVYLNAGTMCMEAKLYLYMGILIFSMICLGIVEIMTKLQNAKCSKPIGKSITLVH